VLALGTRSGELDASVNPVFGASTYNWKLNPRQRTVLVPTARCFYPPAGRRKRCQHIFPGRV
jgi:hypothetical protein